MCNQKEYLLKELMAAEFSAIDLQLYLDTHPQDMRAMAMFIEYAKSYKMLKDQYQRMYGPICVYDSDSCKSSWQWVETPWPWEKHRDMHKGGY